MNRTDIRFMQHILTRPFVLLKKLASAIDLSWSFAVFVIHLTENFSFLAGLLSPFFKTVVDHFFHQFRIFTTILFLVVYFTLRFICLFRYRWFVHTANLVWLKILLGAASSWKIVFVSDKRFVGLSIVWIIVGVKRHSVTFTFGIAEFFRCLIEWWGSVKKRGALIFYTSLTEINMDGFWVCPEGIILKKRLLFGFSPCVWRKSMMRTESVSVVSIFEEVVFSSRVIFWVVNLNSLAKKMRITKLIDRAFVQIFCSEFGFG